LKDCDREDCILAMKIICVDDEPRVLRYTVSQCEKVPGIKETRGFTEASEALAWAEKHRVDIALLDIDMPGMNGIALGVRLKKLNPDTAIIFLTAYKEFAFDAFSAHPSGYLLKPVTQEEVEREIAYAASRHPEKPHARIYARTFGSFDLMVDEKAVAFSRSRAKEILAYLIDRQGESVSRADVFAALWGDREYDYSMQKQLDVYIRSLRETLRAYGAEEIFELSRGVLRVFPEKFECDMYQLLAGDVEMMNAFRGEYMRTYGWANEMEALLSEKCRGALR